MLIQSGIYGHYLDYSKYIENLAGMMIEEDLDFNENLPIAFTINDLKY